MDPSTSIALWPGGVEALSRACRAPEPECVARLLPQARVTAAQAQAIRERALKLVHALRARQGEGRTSRVQGLMQEFALSSQEGVALMCLAEALLRIPDLPTRDALIRDTLARGDWSSHLGHSPSLFVNAATWGLAITGRLSATHSDEGLRHTLRRALLRGGEPLLRAGVDLAMRLLGEQFVAGQSIDEALRRAQAREARGFLHSYDMLGEAALTVADAERYTRAYEDAIRAIGRSADRRGPHDGPGVSIKLSALHPRYQRSQRERVLSELAPRLTQLARLAAEHDIGLAIDAEESERLLLSLELFQGLCRDPELRDWQGLGFVVQAYQKRAPEVIDGLVTMARERGTPLRVRLVKGAYWDSEIKRAQAEGQADFPVYTRKAHTDLSYIVCARRLLAAPDAVLPQFATHNAQSLATLITLAGPEALAQRVEFQCLHGMGEDLYEPLVAPPPQGGLGLRCRIYAPVGTHDTLLAYLVRRLLENGANTSFVHRVADASQTADALVEDPVDTVTRATGRGEALGSPHPGILAPPALWGPARPAARGWDLHDEVTLQGLTHALSTHGLSTLEPADEASDAPVHDTGATATPAQIAQALAETHQGGPAWAATAPAERARILRAAAHRLESDAQGLLVLLVAEAGRTLPNALAEIREAVDFLRYDAAQIEALQAARPDPPEATPDPPPRDPALGLVVCISPWNFPLAIFIGQVAAALAAGRAVIAKPAEQTPKVAARAVQLLHEAGVPRSALALVQGPGETVGPPLLDDDRVQAVLFTGSTEVARHIQRRLARRLDAHGQPPTLVAETGGQNAMIVDSSALPEQVVADVMVSAFDSAGQRCSALRVLCLQQDIADRVLEMLEGALRTWRLGDPAALATDIGPVIEVAAQERIEAHLARMTALGLPLRRRLAPPDPPDIQGHPLVAPAVVEIDTLDRLQAEVFGPVLHVLRYRRDELDTLVARLRGLGWGLTMGVHTRVDETIARIVRGAAVGNLYVNRSMIGAVVGSQPFGGEGLSGTGPKAGGPLYLLRLLPSAPGAARAAVEAAGPPVRLPVRGLEDEAPMVPEARAALEAAQAWAQDTGRTRLLQQIELHAGRSPCSTWRRLPGPTGELNAYAVRPRERLLGLVGAGPTQEDDRLTQLAVALALGAQLLWTAEAAPFVQSLPTAMRTRIGLVQDWRGAFVAFDAVLLHGEAPERLAVAQALAEREGPIVPLLALDPGAHDLPLERLVVERALSLNTAAAGGNASLMSLS